MSDKSNLEKRVTDPDHERLYFRNLMHHISDAIYFKDLESRYLVISDAHAKMYGLAEPGDAIGKSDFDFFTIEHAQQAYDDEQEIIRSGKPKLNMVEKETWPDGHTTWVSTSKIPLMDGEGHVMGTFGISRDITDRKIMEDNLQTSEENLRIQNRVLEEDLERARTIQTALLPTLMPVHDRIYVDCRYKPLEAIGGDYFSFYPLKGDGIGVFIGDLMGHGVSAALFMALIKFLTDSLAPTCGHNSKIYLESLNRKLMNQMPATFITALYGHFHFDSDANRANFNFAGAGHPDPILQKAGSGDVETLPQKGNAAIGIIKEFETEQMELLLEKGDRIFMYTDGIPETMDSKNCMLGEERLMALIKESYDPKLNKTLDRIFEGLERFRGDSEAQDDILLIGFEVI